MSAITESLRKSSINIQNISNSLSATKKNLSTVNDSVDNISRIIATNTRIKRELFTRSDILISRREEASKRQELEDQIESSNVSTTPSRGLSFAAKSTKGPLGRLLGFLGFITAGWIVENLPTWIFMGKEFITRIQIFGRSMYNMIDNMKDVINAFGSILKNSFNAILTLDLNEFSEGSVAQSFDELNLAVRGVGDDITETFRLFTTPLNQSVETGEQAPGLGEERPDTMFPGVQQEGVGTVTGIHKQALDIIAGPESGGNYNAMNQGTDAQGRILGSGDSKKIIGKALTDMTIGEVIDRQNESKYPRNAKPDRGIHAAGKYQIIGNTLPTAMRKAGLKPSDKFSSENQDLLGLAILKDKGIGAWTSGGSRYTAKETAIIKQAQRTPVAVVTSTKPSAPKATAQAPGKTPGYSQAVAFGKSLLAKGYKNIWQHPDFNWNSGYTGSGKERVASRDYNSYHNYGEALDVSAYNGEGKLDALYAELNKNKGKYGIAELLWRTKGHEDHLHISFNKTGATLTSTAPTQVQPAQIAAPPSRMGQPAAMTPERTGEKIFFIDDTQPQSPQVSYPSQQPSTQTPTISEFKLLNNFIKNKLLVDLAYL